MVFGVLKDIKVGENRVICTPVEVASIAAAGHTVSGRPEEMRFMRIISFLPHIRMQSTPG